VLVPVHGNDHQQYRLKKSGADCGIGGTGVACQIGTGAQA